MTVKPLHKLDSLMKALKDHERFEKSIILVERVSVAEALAEKLSTDVLILGWSSPSVTNQYCFDESLFNPGVSPELLV